MKLRLPELNQRIGVLLADGRMLSTRVEDLAEPELVVAPPADQGVTYLMSVGEEVMLEWTTERGLLQGRGRVTRRSQVGVPWVRIAVDESSISQRREYVRVECANTIDVRKDGERFTGTAVDLSGAGVRLSVPLELELGDVVTVVLYMKEGSAIEARCSVVRIDGNDVYALQFDVIDEREQERLVRHVFDAHRRELATVRRSS